MEKLWKVLMEEEITENLRKVKEVGSIKLRSLQ